MKTITTQATAFVTQYSGIKLEELHLLEDASKLMFVANDYHPTGWIKVGTAQITVTLDETNEVIDSKVASLKAELAAIRAESQVMINEIEDQIAKLSALTFESSEYDFDVTLYPYGMSKEYGVVGIDTKKKYGYWEYKDGSEGGGLWFGLDEELGQPCLEDYDGAYELPHKVVSALRAFGVLVQA